MGTDSMAAAAYSPAGESHQPAIPHSLIYFILALALVRGIIYASVVPPWQAPDEPAQFERAKAAWASEDWYSTPGNEPAWYGELASSLFTFRWPDYLFDRVNADPQQPLGKQIALYHQVYEGEYGNRISYAVLGLPLFLAQRQDIVLQLYLVRLNMVLLAAAIIFLAYLIARTIFPNHPVLFLGVPILILFNPEHSHILSTVNNGNLADLLTVIALYFMVRGLIRGFSWVDILAIFGFSLAAMWTKATAYFLAAPIGCLGLFLLWGYRRYWYWLILGGIVLGGAAIYLAPARLRTLFYSGWWSLTGGGLHLNPDVVTEIFYSFWAMPGWLALRLPLFWYQILFAACVLAAAGWVVLVIRKRHDLFSPAARPKVKTLAVLGVSIAAAITIQVGWHVLTGSLAYSHGRSLYPVIVPISIFLMLGWQQLLPAGWQKTGLLAITLALFLFDTMVLFDYIVPFFYSQYG